MRRLNIDVSATGAITDAATITLATTPPPIVPESRLILITDCQGNADLFRQSASVSNQLSKPTLACSSPQPGNIAPATSPWSLFGDPSGYTNSAQVFEAVTRAYYVGISNASGEPALFQIDPLAGGSSSDPLTGVELVEGVENLQVLYGVSGIDNGRAVEDWYPAHQVPNWNLVIAVRLAVVVRSNARADASAVQEQFFSTGTAITTPADSRLRREYSTVVALRNRVVVGEFL
jgi:type IV pilus assembly protein PilW